MTTTAEYNFEVLKTADLPLADRLYLKRKKELIEMICRQDRLEKSMNAHNTTVQYEVEGGDDFDLSEMVSEDVYDKIHGFDVFFLKSKYGYVQHAIIRVRCSDRDVAERVMLDIQDWIDYEAEDVNYISCAYLN